jgi:hypothetical protein
VLPLGVRSNGSPVAIGAGGAIQMVIEGGKLTHHHFRNAVFTASDDDTPQVDRTLRGTSYYLIMRWMRRLARLSSERLG